MIQTKPFSQRIIFLGVIPVLIAVLLLALSFGIIHNHQTQALEKQVIDIAERILIPHLSEEYISNETHDIALSLLSIEQITHISILEKKNHHLVNIGLPITDHSKITFNDASPPSLINQTKYKTRSFLYADKPYWLIIGINAPSFSIARYHGYFALIIISILAMAITSHFSSRLYYAVTRPLKMIITGLREALSNTSDKLLNKTKNPLFNELIETLNEMILMQQSARDEMQNHIDQATKELRETLETVEIQNIELDFARKNALQASRAKSEFLANTSHELRTPLNGILGFTSLLLKTNLSNQQKDYLGTIEQSAEGLLRVINDILDFSKLETGQLTLEHQPLHIRELIEEVFTLHAPHAHEKNIRLICLANHNISSNLLGDPHRLKQVINNLVSNAIKFSHRGNIIVKATCLAEMDNQAELKITVTDEGIGLNDEQQENLFSAFTKVDSSDSRFQGGTGLGLAIAKGLVDRMRGEIGVESTYQKGSTFWFTVRLGLDPQKHSRSTMTNSLHGLNILVFDNNSSSRAEITHLLSNWGVTTLEEGNFRNILNILASNIDNRPIDLIIIDALVKENEFDRDRLLSELRKIRSNFKLPVIISAPPSIQRTLQNDIIYFDTAIISRPIIQSQLYQALNNLLNLKSRDAKNKTPEQHFFPKSASHQGTNVLVVDDNPANLKLTQEFLIGLGANVTLSNNGYEAIECCKKNTFDLILMDVQMPGLDGLETTKILREQEDSLRTPIVALTAHAVTEQKTQLLLAGMDDFLRKPIHENDLKHILDRWTKERNTPNRTVSDNNPLVSEQEDLTQKNSFENNSNLVEVSGLRLFDREESLKLSNGKNALAAEMLIMLVNSLPDTLEKAHSAFQNRQLNDLQDIAHKLYGGCCYCGVPALRNASHSLEKALQEEKHSELPMLLKELTFQIQELINWAEEHDLEIMFED